jgi:hypothetical protein
MRTELKIEGEKQVNETQASDFLYQNRADWKPAFFTKEQNQQLFQWVCDRCDYEDGSHAFRLRIDGRQGYLTYQYDSNLGIEGIEFFSKISARK